MGDSHGFSRMARGRGGGVGVLTLMFGHAAGNLFTRAAPTKCDILHPLGLLRVALVVVLEFRPVRVALLQERIAALNGFVCHVGKAGGLAGEHLLSHQAIIGEVEGELQHALRCGGLAEDLLGGLDRLIFQISMIGHNIDCTHALHGLRIVGATQEEDFAGKFLAHHLCQVCGTITGVKTSDIRISLLKARVLAGCDRHVAHHVQGVAAAGSPTTNYGDDHLRHSADQALYLKDVQAAAFGLLARDVNSVGSVAVGVAVAAAASDALVAAGAEGPAAVLR